MSPGIRPTVDQKLDLARSLAETAHALGESTGRAIALMAATESVNAGDARDRRRRRAHAPQRAGEFAGCVVQGPLSFDLAYAADAGGKKRIDGRSSARPTRCSSPTSSRPT